MQRKNNAELTIGQFQHEVPKVSSLCCSKLEN